ncbi:hypothetical protein [Vibrio celticus]|nr:hypothetical protein [Vibrio celticus]
MVVNFYVGLVMDVVVLVAANAVVLSTRVDASMINFFKGIPYFVVPVF